MGFHTTITYKVPSTQHKRTMAFKKTGTWLNIISKSATLTLRGDVSLACYFYCGRAKWNPMLPAGSGRAWIEAKINTAISEWDLSRGFLLLGGHRGATAFKWAIQLWNIVGKDLQWVWLKSVRRSQRYVSNYTDEVYNIFESGVFLSDPATLIFAVKY